MLFQDCYFLDFKRTGPLTTNFFSFFSLLFTPSLPPSSKGPSSLSGHCHSTLCERSWALPLAGACDVNFADNSLWDLGQGIKSLIYRVEIKRLPHRVVMGIKWGNIHLNLKTVHILWSTNDGYCYFLLIPFSHLTGTHHRILSIWKSTEKYKTGQKEKISEQLKLVSMGWNTFYLQMRFLFWVYLTLHMESY